MGHCKSPWEDWGCTLVFCYLLADSDIMYRHIAQHSQQTLDGVATSIHDFSGEFRFVKSEVASIRQFSEESNTLQRDHYDRVENHLAMYTTSLSTTVSTTQNHNTALIAQNSELITEIGNLRKLLATQERGSTSQYPSRVGSRYQPRVQKLLTIYTGHTSSSCVSHCKITTVTAQEAM